MRTFAGQFSYPEISLEEIVETGTAFFFRWDVALGDGDGVETRTSIGEPVGAGDVVLIRSGIVTPGGGDSTRWWRGLGLIGRTGSISGICARERGNCPTDGLGVAVGVCVEVVVGAAAGDGDITGVVEGVVVSAGAGVSDGVGVGVVFLVGFLWCFRGVGDG